MGMFKLNEQVFDVTWHTNATATICIVPFDINTRKLISSHVELDPVEFLENVQEVVEVFDSNIFYAKVIHDEAELDRTPFVAPETRGGFNFIIAFSKTCKANWFNMGPNGFGSGRLVSDTLVEGLSGGEECKWGRCRCPGAGAVGNGLSCRETRRRDW